jgi:hypothetical protein
MVSRLLLAVRVLTVATAEFVLVILCEVVLGVMVSSYEVNISDHKMNYMQIVFECMFGVFLASTLWLTFEAISTIWMLKIYRHAAMRRALFTNFIVIFIPLNLMMIVIIPAYVFIFAMLEAGVYASRRSSQSGAL